MPEDPFDLAVRHYQSGRLPQAESACEQVLQSNPNHPDATQLLGIVKFALGRRDEGLALLARLVAAHPASAQFHHNYGLALAQSGRWTQAIAEYLQSVKLRPDDLNSWISLAAAAESAGQHAQGIEARRQAARIKPDWQNNFALGNALLTANRPDEAIASFEKSIEQKPDFANAHNNLARALADTAQIDASIAAFDRAISAAPEDWRIYSGKLFTRHFDPSAEPKQVFQEHRRFDERFAPPHDADRGSFPNDRNPLRRLRIGYVSPNFKLQAEAFFTLPLLAHHDHSQFEIFCYSETTKPDDWTARLRPHADVWRDTTALDDDALAQRIRDDRIDVLIDLTMHMAGGRPLVFARKPAPVQACWLAYPGTTGLRAMDFRITDRFIDPPDHPTPYYTEQSIRLPDCWVCYDPQSDLPPAPPRDDGPIRFGCLNHPRKLNSQTIAEFLAVLRAVDGSQLLLLVDSPNHRDRIARQAAEFSIDPRRIEFVATTRRADYLELYHRFDISLDTLPYNGITTTCDSLWMGVPAISLAGATAPGRAGLSILATAGFPEWAARDSNQFVELTRSLAADRPRLAELRRTLRDRFARSPVMDGPRFARNMESAYREMFRAWIAFSAI